MKTVIITGDSPAHNYVTNQICAAMDVAAIFVCDPTPPRSWKKMLRATPGRFVSKTLRSLYLKLIGDAAARDAALITVLGEDSHAIKRDDLVSRVGRPRAGVLAEQLRAETPDVLAIYGTGIIPDDVLELAGTVALNMHTGLSPWYRGVACAFWPLAFNEPHMIGATVHECTSDVDGGRIFATQQAQLVKGDGLHAVFARAVLAGTRSYIDVLKAAQKGPLVGEPQDLNIGREFRGSQLGIMAELKARAGLRKINRNLDA